MLFVGDILQLPPVNGTPVFQQVPNKVVALRLGLYRLSEHLERGRSVR